MFSWQVWAILVYILACGFIAINMDRIKRFYLYLFVDYHIYYMDYDEVEMHSLKIAMTKPCLLSRIKAFRDSLKNVKTSWFSATSQPIILYDIAPQYDYKLTKRDRAAEIRKAREGMQ